MLKRSEGRWQKQRKVYFAPCIVDFGAIEAMTGDCWGVCEDGMNGGMDWAQP